MNVGAGTEGGIDAMLDGRDIGGGETLGTRWIDETARECRFDFYIYLDENKGEFKKINVLCRPDTGH